MSAPGNRDRSGRFVPGASGNPTGRPKSQREVQQLAESYSGEAIERLATIMRSKNAAEAGRAAVAILDRAYGRPAQALDVTARRGPDVGAIGGQPDAARARLEALIFEARASAGAVLQHVATEAERDYESGEKGQITEVSPALTADGSASCPTVAPTGTETEATP